MRPVSWEQARRWTGGKLLRGSGTERFSKVSIDSRTLAAGGVFWAIQGERFDGHDFLKDVGAASGWVVSRDIPAGGEGPAILRVDRTLEALQRFASEYRNQFDLGTAAVTGSNGKTTTKEMLRSILARLGPTAANRGNFNNPVGVPLSLLEIEEKHRFGVFEIGANHRGEIAMLAQWVKPKVGVITNIGKAHVGLFGGIEGVFEAKTELLGAMEPSRGCAVLNADDPWLRKALDRWQGPLRRFGSPGSGAEVVFRSRDASTVELEMEGRSFSAKLPVEGRLNHPNAAAAAAAASVLGASPEQIVEGLEGFEAAPMRLEVRRLKDGSRVVFDAYNANPSSVESALRGFCEDIVSKRKIAVLGDMKELGEASGELHEAMGPLAASLPLDGVLFIGEESRRAFDWMERHAPQVERRHAVSIEDASESLKPWLGEGVAVFMKASRAMGFEKLLERIG